MTKYPAGVTVCEADGESLVPEATFAHVDRDLQAGDVVGEYRVEGKLGEGGFGTVYRAVHPVIGKPAAIKVLARQYSTNPQMVSRFIAEARAVNQIGHRNIIQTFSFGQTADGRQYYMMDLLDGVPFDKHLAQRGPLTLAQAMPILRGIARAIDAAHAKGILHRDLKPENVYLVFDEDGGIEPKLLDFGLAKLVGETSGNHKTKTGTPMGTPYYMSPEQCRGIALDGRTDVYAFGAMVFEVLTGRVPFPGATPMDVLVKHMSDEAPAASSVNAGVPAELDAPIARMLAKEPDARPRTIGAALDALAEAARMSVPARAAPARSPASVESIATVPTIVGGLEGSGAVKIVTGDPVLTTTQAALDPTPGAGTSGGASAAMSSAGGGAAARSTSDAGAPASSPAASGATFLGAEAGVPQVPASRARARSLVVAGIGGLALLAAVALGFGLARGERADRAGSGGDARSASSSSPRHEAPARPAGSSAELASAPPSASASASAHVPAKIQLRVEGAPAGAKVTIDGKRVGPAPGPFDLAPGASVELQVSAKGYKARTVPLTVANEDVIVPITLEKKVSVPPPKKNGTSISKDLEGFDPK
jgi:serine/threonine-protein kinase